MRQWPKSVQPFIPKRYHILSLEKAIEASESKDAQVIFAVKGEPNPEQMTNLVALVENALNTIPCAGVHTSKPSILDPSLFLAQAERDSLCARNINPIIAYSRESMAVWNNKIANCPYSIMEVAIIRTMLNVIHESKLINAMSRNDERDTHIAKSKVAEVVNEMRVQCLLEGSYEDECYAVSLYPGGYRLMLNIPLRCQVVDLRVTNGINQFMPELG